MGREARRKKQQPPQSDEYRVRTGAEIEAKFGERLREIYDAIRLAHERRDSPSFDERREQLKADGLITQNEDGSATYAMSPLTSQLLKLRLEIFRFKFGREPRENDPVFFDFNADTPQPQGTDDADGDKMIATLRVAALQVGVDPDRAVEHFLGREDFDAYKDRRQS